MQCIRDISINTAEDNAVKLSYCKCVSTVALQQQL